jgi:hypothetical protein
MFLYIFQIYSLMFLFPNIVNGSLLLLSVEVRYYKYIMFYFKIFGYNIWTPFNYMFKGNCLLLSFIVNV